MLLSQGFKKRKLSSRKEKVKSESSQLRDHRFMKGRQDGKWETSLIAR